MVEHFYHTLAIHMFFHKSGHVGKGNLLAHKVFSTVSTDFFCDKYQNPDDNNGKQCQQGT